MGSLVAAVPFVPESPVVSLEVGAMVKTRSGRTGNIAVIFADGIWAQKFLSCLRCDRTTWNNVDIDEADMSLGRSGPQVLIVDGQGRWRLIDHVDITVIRKRTRRNRTNGYGN